MRWKNVILYLFCTLVVVGAAFFVIMAAGFTVDGMRNDEQARNERIETRVSEKVGMYEADLAQKREEQRRIEAEKREEQERLEQEKKEREKKEQDAKKPSVGPATDCSVLDADGKYVVQSGDTLSYISSLVLCPVDYIADVNNICDVNRIYTGHKLSFPEKPDSHEVYMIEDGDTLGELAVNRGQDMSVISSDNHIRNDNLIYGGTALWLAK